MGNGDVVELFSEWKSFILLIIVLANGYLSLLIFVTLTGYDIYKIPLFDKIVMSILFGFFNLEYLLYISKEVFIKTKKGILNFIGTGGIPLAIIYLFSGVLSGYSSYLLFYIFKTIFLKI